MLWKLHSERTKVSFLLFGSSIRHLSLLFCEVFIVVPQIVDAFIQFFEVFIDLIHFLLLKWEFFCLFWLLFGDDRNGAFIFDGWRRLGLRLRTDWFERVEVVPSFFWFVSRLCLLLLFFFLNDMIVPVLIFVHNIQIDALLQLPYVFPASRRRRRRLRLPIRLILRDLLLWLRCFRAFKLVALLLWGLGEGVPLGVSALVDADVQLTVALHRTAIIK